MIYTDMELYTLQFHVDVYHTRSHGFLGRLVLEFRLTCFGFHTDQAQHSGSVSVPPPRKKRASSTHASSTGQTVDVAPSVGQFRPARRKKSSVPDRTLATGVETTSDLISRCIVIEPDDESRAEDEAAGYTLPLSIGRVVEVDMDPDLMGPILHVEWFYSESFSGKWRVWLEKRNPRMGWVALSEIQRDDSGEIVFVNFTSSEKCLCATSKAVLRSLIGDKCFDEHSSIEDYI